MAEPKARQPETDESHTERGEGKDKAAARPPRAVARRGSAAGSTQRSPAAPSEPTGQPPAAAPAAGPESGEAESLTTAEILAASSEEFRDSLQTLQGALELLVSGKVRDEQKSAHFLQIAYRETGFLSHRVSDLQLASLIETDRLRLRLTTLSLQPMLEHLLQETVAAAAAEQEIGLDLQNPQELPNLQGDEALLRTALTNLLEVALRATPQRGSLLVSSVSTNDTIQLRIESRAPQQGGEGDPPDLRAAEEHSLALFVARHIALAHDGQLEVGRAGREAQFLRLTLPLQPKARRRGRILVVEDNPQAAYLLEFALQEEGYEPVKAVNGPEALRLARDQRFDLVILDVLLPGIDGFEVCHRLRAVPETASIPIIMVSAKAREEDQATALRIGADAYFGKPLGMAELNAAISDLLEAADARGRYGR